MTGRCAKATVPVGTPAWVANERTQVRNLLDQEVEDFAYFARNEFEWLNEHMMEIFERTASHQVDMIQLMKTPARTKARTPRTGLKRRFASPSKLPQIEDTPMEMLSRPPQPLFDIPQLSKERFEQSMVSLNKAAEAIVTSSRRNSTEPEQMPPPTKTTASQPKEKTATIPPAPEQDMERDSGIWLASQNTQESQSQSQSQSQQESQSQFKSFMQNHSPMDLRAPPSPRLSHRSSNQSDVFEDARSSPAPGNDSFETAAQTAPVRVVPAKENAVVSPVKAPVKDFRIPLMEVPDRLSKNDRSDDLQKPAKLQPPLLSKPLGSPRSIPLIPNDRVRYSPTTTQYRLPSPKRSPLRDHFEVRHDSASDSSDEVDEVDDIMTEPEEEHAGHGMDHELEKTIDEHMVDPEAVHEDDHEDEDEQSAQQPEESPTRSPIKRQASAVSTPQSAYSGRVTRSSVQRQLSSTPTTTHAPARPLDRLHSESGETIQEFTSRSAKPDLDVPGAVPKPGADLLADHRKRSYRTSGIATKDEDTAIGSRKVSRSSYTTKVPIKSGEDSSDDDDEELLRRKRAHSEVATNALLEKIAMLRKHSEDRLSRVSMATKTPRARAQAREDVNPDEDYSYSKTPSTNYSRSTYSQSTRSDLKTPGAAYDYTYDFKTPKYGGSQEADLADTGATKKSISFYSPEEEDTSFSRNRSTPNKKVKLISAETINHVRESPARLDKAESPLPESSPSKTPSAPPPAGGILDTLQHTTANAFNKAKNLLLPQTIQSPAAKAALHLTSPPEMREWRRSPNPQSLDEQLRELRNNWDKEDATANYTKEIEITPSKEIVEKVVRKTKSAQTRELRAQEEARLAREKEEREEEERRERERKKSEEEERRAAEEAERLRFEAEEKEKEERRRAAIAQAAEAEQRRLEQEAAEAERVRIQQEEIEAEQRRIEKEEELRRQEEIAILRKEQELERERVRKEKLEKEKEHIRRIAREKLEEREREERERENREREEREQQEREEREQQEREEREQQEREEREQREREVQRQEKKKRLREQARREEEERLLAEERAQKELAREKARLADERRRVAEAEQQKLRKELERLQEQLRIENERVKREEEDRERRRLEEEEKKRLRREEEEKMQRLREEELKRRREEEEQHKREEQHRRRREEEERRKRQEEEEEARKRHEEEVRRRREEEEQQRRIKEEQQRRAIEEEQRRHEEEEQRRHDEEEHHRRLEEQRRIQEAAAERVAREKEAVRELESDEESKTSQPSRPTSRLQRPAAVSKSQRSLRPARTAAQPAKPVSLKTASQREMESHKKHLGQPASTSALNSALKDTFGPSHSQPALANASSFTSVNSASQSSLRSVASSQQGTVKGLKALDSANAAKKKQQEDAERRAAQRQKIAKQRADNKRRAEEKEEARRQMGRQRTVEREIEPKKKPAAQAPPSAGRNLLNRVPAASNLRKTPGDEPAAPKKRPLPDQDYSTIKVVQPDAKRQRSEEYEQAEMPVRPIRSSNMNKNAKMPLGYGTVSKATIKAISSSSTTTTTISTKRESAITKTPGAPNSRVASLKTPQTQKGSPQYINGELIELPDIPSDSEEEDDDDDDDGRKKHFLPPKWAESPELQLALAQQQSWDPQEIFGEIPPLKMEEIFKTRDTKKFRARTSSANWNGADGLTQEEVEAEEQARLQMIKEGKWTYNQLGTYLRR